MDSYTYGVMCSGAGHKPDAVVLDATNIFDEILKANNALDNAEVPETGRILVVTPDVYTIMKRSKDIIMETDIAEDMRLRGVIAMIDGAKVVKRHTYYTCRASLSPLYRNPLPPLWKQGEPFYFVSCVPLFAFVATFAVCS